MLSLIANGPRPSVSTPVLLELKQDGDEVDILMNGVLIAYFVVRDNKIALLSCLDSDDKKFVEADEKGLIKVS